MKIKILLAVTLFFSTMQAFAATPYLSGKLSAARMQNDAYNDVDDRGDFSIVADKGLSDAVIGLKLAAGLSADVPAIKGALRLEAEYGANGKADMAGEYMHNISGFQIPTDFLLSTKTQTVFINLYYDIKTNSDYTPYIGVGAGYAHLDIFGHIENQYDSSSVSYTKENLGWNISAGFGYKMSENVTLDLGYRYTNYGKFSKHEEMGTYTSNSSYKFDSHELGIGLRYSF
ncbi:opacity protein-like surface antigen [Elusimicrobium posterum]|uniref:outer membrane protein n=1 Tax=Elusimicrobium posterum TaxID=3116653 RepID=UPI003C75EC2F